MKIIFFFIFTCFVPIFQFFLIKTLNFCLFFCQNDYQPRSGLHRLSNWFWRTPRRQTFKFISKCFFHQFFQRLSNFFSVYKLSLLPIFLMPIPITFPIFVCSFFSNWNILWHAQFFFWYLFKEVHPRIWLELVPPEVQWSVICMYLWIII